MMGLVYYHFRTVCMFVFVCGSDLCRRGSGVGSERVCMCVGLGFRGLGFRV